MKVQPAAQFTGSVALATLMLFSVVAAITPHAYASSTPHMVTMHSGLVSLAPGQTVRLNVTLNPDLVAPAQNVSLTLSFDVYEAPLIGTDGSIATIARGTVHRSAQLILRAGEAAFLEYTVPRDNTGQMVGASVAVGSPDLRQGFLVPAVMPTLEGRTATGQTIFVLPGAASGFQEVENHPAPNSP